MSETGTTTGKCLCGAVSYRLETAPDHIDACHCSMCRRFSGGIELGIEVPPGGITWQGEDFIRTFASSDWAERGFCSRCGSSLFWRMTAPGPAQGLLSLSAGTLDSFAGLELTTEIYIDHKPAAYAMAGETRKMTEAEVIAAFAPPSEGESQ
ncbi:GFA family protein [Pukyongiella litopenaei]|uniref:GFA family protein n=1 Tax=Pukyongiella litopenaei TaxID=2605946 RepID=A0A2S0MPT0_9RHOB|nr:GFA family protein [Pukyongiella litopenaei]AVO37713.1 GFA family protein [Pukyongiella litopenaei]